MVSLGSGCHQIGVLPARCDPRKLIRQADRCLTIESTMKIDTAHAEPMGSLVVEGKHRPFHALACALKPATVRIKRKIRALIAQ